MLWEGNKSTLSDNDKCEQDEEKEITIEGRSCNTCSAPFITRHRETYQGTGIKRSSKS